MPMISIYLYMYVYDRENAQKYMHTQRNLSTLQIVTWV